MVGMNSEDEKKSQLYGFLRKNSRNENKRSCLDGFIQICRLARKVVKTFRVLIKG